MLAFLRSEWRSGALAFVSSCGPARAQSTGLAEGQHVLPAHTGPAPPAERSSRAFTLEHPARDPAGRARGPEVRDRDVRHAAVALLRACCGSRGAGTACRRSRSPGSATSSTACGDGAGDSPGQQGRPAGGGHPDALVQEDAGLQVRRLGRGAPPGPRWCCDASDPPVLVDQRVPERERQDGGDRSPSLLATWIAAASPRQSSRFRNQASGCGGRPWRRRDRRSRP